MRVFKWALLAGSGVIAAAVLAFGVLGLGAAGAQTPTDKDSRFQRYEQLLAQKLGITVEQLQAAQKGARDQMIDEAVSQGLITQQQGEELKSRPAGGPPLFGRMQAGVRHVVGNVIQAAAGVLGMSEDEVRAGLRDGQSLSAMAQGKGISRDALKSGMEARLRAEIQQAQANGTISQEMATRLLNGLDQHLDQVIDGTPQGLRDRIEQHAGPRLRQGGPLRGR